MANHSRKEAENAGIGLLGFITSLFGVGVAKTINDKRIDNQIEQKRNEYWGLGNIINHSEIEDLEKKKWW